MHNFTLEVKPGEVVALIGANGAGKSTMINAISGLIPPAEGKILFQGERIDGTPAEKIVRKGLIQVAEGRELFPTLTVLENLSMGAYTLQRKGEDRGQPGQRLPSLSHPGREGEEPGPDAERRGTADAGDRPRAHVESPDDHARRTLFRSRPHPGGPDLRGHHPLEQRERAFPFSLWSKTCSSLSACRPAGT